MSYIRNDIYITETQGVKKTILTIFPNGNVELINTIRKNRMRLYSQLSTDKIKGNVH